MKNKYKINLPVIAERTKGDFELTKQKKYNFKIIKSTFYQTSEVMCENFYKPLYLKSKNDK